MAESCAMFLSVLLNSQSQAHQFHWETKSYARHKALEKYYETIGDLADDYAETYMGLEGERVTGFTVAPEIYTADADVLSYFTALEQYVRDAAKALPTSPDLVNIHADILALIHRTQYLLSLS